MKLQDIAIARSGDKGDRATLSVIARQPADYPVLERLLTVAAVKAHYAGIVRGEVERYALPHLGAVHFVLHAACVGDTVTVTPMFTGSFAAEVKRGPDAGKRPLGAAVEVAFELARSLAEPQRKIARIMDAPPADVLWAVGQDAKAPEMKGLSRAAMTDAQKALVDRLLAVHAGLLDEGVADAQLREWRTKHAGELVFAFVGDTDLHKPHYYRIATPNFTIEYDSTNADASHVHCVWSDPSANFGGDALRAHLKDEHAAGASR
jgi:hypothetical protein